VARLLIWVQEASFSVQWFEGDIVLAKQAFIIAEAVQQLSFREPATSLTRRKCGGGYTLDVGFDTISTGELAVAFHFSMLALCASENALWLRIRC